MQIDRKCNRKQILHCKILTPVIDLFIYSIHLNLKLYDTKVRSLYNHLFFINFIHLSNYCLIKITEEDTRDYFFTFTLILISHHSVWKCIAFYLVRVFSIVLEVQFFMYLFLDVLLLSSKVLRKFIFSCFTNHTSTYKSNFFHIYILYFSYSILSKINFKQWILSYLAKNVVYKYNIVACESFFSYFFFICVW